MLGLKSKTVRLEPYNEKWASFFQIEKEKLSKALKNFDVDIQHIGSTAIIGCRAKPIIDIAVGLPNLEYGQQLIPIFESIGYIYSPDANFGVRWYFKKITQDLTTHFIHVVGRDSRIWQNHIVFRDYLNEKPELVKEYSKFKEQSAKGNENNRALYGLLKDPFIESIIVKALTEKNIERAGEDYKIPNELSQIH